MTNGLSTRPFRTSGFVINSSFVIRASSLSSYLPVLDELGRDFFEEARRPLKDISEASTQTHVGEGKIKLVPRAGDRDVKEAPLFFNRVACLERARAWKHSVGKPDHKHGMVLEPLGLVHRGEVHRFRVGRLIERRLRVDVADERE